MPAQGGLPVRQECGGRASPNREAKKEWFLSRSLKNVAVWPHFVSVPWKFMGCFNAEHWLSRQRKTYLQPKAHCKLIWVRGSFCVNPAQRWISQARQDLIPDLDDPKGAQNFYCNRWSPLAQEKHSVFIYECNTERECEMLLFSDVLYVCCCYNEISRILWSQKLWGQIWKPNVWTALLILPEVLYSPADSHRLSDLHRLRFTFGFDSQMNIV